MLRLDTTPCLADVRPRKSPHVRKSTRTLSFFIEERRRELHTPADGATVTMHVVVAIDAVRLGPGRPGGGLWRRMI